MDFDLISNASTQPGTPTNSSKKHCQNSKSPILTRGKQRQINQFHKSLPQIEHPINQLQNNGEGYGQEIEHQNKGTFDQFNNNPYKIEN